MNVILTLLWFAVVTVGSYFGAKHFDPQHVILITSLGFVTSVLLRFFPESAGGIAEGIADSIDFD